MGDPSLVIRNLRAGGNCLDDGRFPDWGYVDARFLDGFFRGELNAAKMKLALVVVLRPLGELKGALRSFELPGRDLRFGF
jgi:hypothetical protein